MHIEQVIEKFIYSSIMYGEAIKSANSRKANKYSKIVRTIRKELIINGKVQLLLPYLKHDNDYVKLSVASGLVFIQPEESIKILENLKRKGGLLGFEASMFIEEYRKGNINPYKI